MTLFVYGAGPVLALLALGLLGVASRWVWSPHADAVRPEYGLLVEVVTMADRADAEAACLRLADCGVRATVGTAPAVTLVSAQGAAVLRPAGHHVLVFPEQRERAVQLLGG